MSGHPTNFRGNRLIALLEPDDAERLTSLLEPVECPRRMRLADPDEPMSHVYFLDEGVASVVVVTPEGMIAEAGIIGREGFVMPNAVLGVDRVPHICEMQLPGAGGRISFGDFLQVSLERSGLRKILSKFLHCYLTQGSYTSLSNAVHQIDERLARWLLMCHDRWDSDDIPLTHEYMSTMLAVRRPTVTTALHVLEGNRLIGSDRGCVHIRDRRGLEDFAADSYGKAEAEYRRLLEST